MKSISNVLWALTIAIAAATTTIAGHAGPLPMPPSFTDEVAPETVLRAYPLGNITKQAAFSHHGKAVRSLTLPNGKRNSVIAQTSGQARLCPQWPQQCSLAHRRRTRLLPMTGENMQQVCIS